MKTSDLYIVSAIKKAWEQKGNLGKLDMNKFQEIYLIKTDKLPVPTSNERVDTIVVGLENNCTNSEVIGVVFAHYHTQKREDNWGINILIKEK